MAFLIIRKTSWALETPSRDDLASFIESNSPITFNEAKQSFSIFFALDGDIATVEVIGEGMRASDGISAELPRMRKRNPRNVLPRIVAKMKF